MRKVLKKFAFWPMRVTSKYSKLLGRLRTDWSYSWNDTVYLAVSSQVTEVVHRGGRSPVEMRFYTPNAVCRFRASTFSTKEPETLEWIDQFGSEGAFFDVGANIGLYSVYYARTQSGKVYAFEPSVLNLGVLARNIDSNSLSSKIVIVPLPLTSVNQIAPMQLTSSQEGGALSTFGADYGHDGKELQTAMEYQMPGFTLDFLLSSRLIPQPPSLIKIDVDGIEHLILEGAKATLALPHLRSVLVEVNDEFHQQANEVSLHLSEA